MLYRVYPPRVSISTAESGQLDMTCLQSPRPSSPSGTSTVATHNVFYCACNGRGRLHFPDQRRWFCSSARQLVSTSLLPRADPHIRWSPSAQTTSQRPLGCSSSQSVRFYNWCWSAHGALVSTSKPTRSHGSWSLLAVQTVVSTCSIRMFFWFVWHRSMPRFWLQDEGACLFMA